MCPKEQCSDCGAKCVIKRKWNSGDPKDFSFPTYDCQDQRNNKELDQWLERRKIRIENYNTAKERDWK